MINRRQIHNLSYAFMKEYPGLTWKQCYVLAEDIYIDMGESLELRGYLHH